MPCSDRPAEHLRPADLLARCTFAPPGAELTCAVSGGADSLALLVLAVEAGCRVTAAHVDHGLRAGSAAEADVVRAAAERFGAGFRSLRVHVEPGPNLEARARAARRAALPADAATGHTADDQAETVIMNLLRGAGLDGMAGMAGGPSKPILRLRRHETRALCDAVGLHPVDDPSNRDPAHLRNRVRHEVMPLLDAVAGRDVAGVLARQAQIARADVEALEAQAQAVDVEHAAELVAAHPAIARRAVRRWLRSAGGPERHPPDAATVDRVLAVAAKEAAATDVGRGWRVTRSAGRLRLQHD